MRLQYAKAGDGGVAAVGWQSYIEEILWEGVSPLQSICVPEPALPKAKPVI
jgi:hypothetical protein